MNKSFSIIGGDTRSIYLAKTLMKNADVKVYKLNSDIPEVKNLKEAINSDYIISPIPFKEELFKSVIEMNIEEFFNMLKGHEIFIGCNLNKEIVSIANRFNIKTIDILKIEEFAVLNAIPTAEGAIKIAMSETSKTLHNSKVIVSGFGRIAKILSKMLTGIGSKVHVVCRDSGSLAMAKGYGYIDVPLKDVETILPTTDIIFNTIPHIVFDKNKIDKTNRNCVYIEIASHPYGIDLNYAEQKCIKTIIASSLPGKVAPESAGEYIKYILYRLINQKIL